MSASSSNPLSREQVRELLASRAIEKVVVLGANGTMGYGSAALFTQAVPQVTFLASTKSKAEEGLGAAVTQVRSHTVASRSRVAERSCRKLACMILTGTRPVPCAARKKRTITDISRIRIYCLLRSKTLI